MDFSLTCPYCGEPAEIEVDPTEEPSEQEFVEDCGVCCRPWTVRAVTDAEGNVDVQVDRA